MVTRTRIIRIGNSQGVRVPRSLLEQAGFSEGDQAVELEVRQEGILIRHAKRARSGWAAQFAQMAEHGDDTLLDDALQASSWDEQEWQW